MNFFGGALAAAKSAYEYGASTVTQIGEQVTAHVPAAAALQESIQAKTGTGPAADQNAGGSGASGGGKDGKKDDKTDGEGEKKEEEPEENFGQIEYSLDYNFEKSTMSITIIQCKELPAMDMGGTSDPYVKVYILPDKKKKFLTKKLKKTLNPVYNETFKFEKLPFNEMSNKTMVFCVYDHDAVGADDMIGEVQIPMASIDLGADDLHFWKMIKEPPKNVLGDICLSLRYAPQKKPPQLTVLVIECKNLKQMDLGGASDPYVKVNHMVNGKRVKKYKTPVKMSDLNPYWNQSFKIEVNPYEMNKTEFQIFVMDYDKIGSNDAIGWVNLSLKDQGTAGKHWRTVLANPKKSIAQWHPLLPIEDD